MRIFVAKMHTENFDFLSTGLSAELAKSSILKGWKRHFKEMKTTTDRNTVEELDEWYGINVVEMDVGGCTRDYYEIA